MTLLKRLFSHIRLRIRSGPNQGLWWSATSGSRYLRGDFVRGKATCLQRLVLPGEVVWDIGSHRGFTVLVESRVVGPSGRVFAFEPNPESRGLLERHVRWNHLRNVTVFPWAMGRSEGQMTFGWERRNPDAAMLPALEKRSSSLACHLGGEGHTVRVRHVDGIIAEGTAPAPTLLKIDVEGAELDVLEGASTLLAREPGLAIVLATHSPAVHEACCERLRREGMEVVEAENVATGRREGWGAVGDTDVLAFKPGRNVPSGVKTAFAAIDLHG